MKQRIKLSDHFSMLTIFLFALPSIGMQIVDNTYQVADGFFISNFIGEAAFDAENLIFPALLIVLYVGLMFGTGGSALISKELGEGHREKANQLLSMIVATLIALGIILSVVMYFMMPTVARWVNASDALAPYCITYGRVLTFFMPFQILSMAFHPLLITAEQSKLGLITTISNAVANIFLDWAFVAGFKWGMPGAAVATGLAWLISAIIPIVYFMNQSHPLHFTRPTFDLGTIWKTMYNGASEMVDGVSYAIVALIFNLQMLRYLGDNGVGAYAVSEYVGGLFSAVFYGVSMSIVPVVGFHLGRKNLKELHSLRHNGLLLMGIFGVIMTALSMLLARPIARVFVGYNESLTALSTQGLHLISLSFLLAGITTYSSSYFTGLNQGTASLIISVMKGFVGPLTAIFILPKLIGTNGLWLAQPAQEILALIAALLCFMWWYRDEPGNVEKAVAEGNDE